MRLHFLNSAVIVNSKLDYCKRAQSLVCHGLSKLKEFAASSYRWSYAQLYMFQTQDKPTTLWELHILRDQAGRCLQGNLCTVRLPVWRHVSRQWLSKQSVHRRDGEKFRFYHGNTVPISWIWRFQGPYCHRKLDLSTFLEWNVQWCNEF